MLFSFGFFENGGSGGFMGLECPFHFAVIMLGCKVYEMAGRRRLRAVTAMRRHRVAEVEAAASSCNGRAAAGAAPQALVE